MEALIYTDRSSNGLNLGGQFMWYVGGRGNPKGLLFQISILIMGIGAVACGKLPDYQVMNDQNAFVAEANLNPDVDMLFVIDNSGSMGPDQNNLAAGFSAFISNFTSKALHYHIGIVSTDTCPMASSTCNLTWWSTSSSHYNGIYNNGMGSLLTKSLISPGVPRKFLDWSMGVDEDDSKTQTINKFTANVALGTNASGSEAPLQTAASAINQQAGYNAGFFRPGAFTAVIIVSDEDESYGFAGSPSVPSGLGSGNYLSGRAVEGSDGFFTEEAGGTLTSADQLMRINAFYAALEGLKNVDPAAPASAKLPDFSLNVIAVPHDATTCSVDVASNGVLVPEYTSNFEPALTLHQAVVVANTYDPPATGAQKGTFTNICSTSATITAALDQIGSDIVEANASYLLDNNCPQSATIQVFVNSVLVPRSVVNGWEYISATNRIQFYGTAVPKIGDSIVTDYTPGCPL
jgi:hypothetical protein